MSESGGNRVFRALTDDEVAAGKRASHFQKNGKWYPIASRKTRAKRRAARKKLRAKAAGKRKGASSATKYARSKRGEPAPKPGDDYDF